MGETVEYSATVENFSEVPGAPELQDLWSVTSGSYDSKQRPVETDLLIEIQGAISAWEVGSDARIKIHAAELIRSAFILVNPELAKYPQLVKQLQSKVDKAVITTSRYSKSQLDEFKKNVPEFSLDRPERPPVIDGLQAIIDASETFQPRTDDAEKNDGSNKIIVDKLTRRLTRSAIRYLFLEESNRLAELPPPKFED